MLDHINPFYDIIFLLRPHGQSTDFSVLSSSQESQELCRVDGEYYCFNFNPNLTGIFGSPKRSVDFQLIHHLYDCNGEVIEVSPKYHYPTLRS